MTTVVLLPGMDGTGELFDEFAAQLGGVFDVAVGSYPRDRALTFDELVEHAATFIPSVGRFVVVAESFSGPVGVALAARYQDRMDGLVLCATFVRAPWPFLSLASRVAKWMPLGAMPRGLLSAALLGKLSTPGLIERFMIAVRSVSAAVLASRIEVVARVDVSAALRALRLPVMSLCAGDDRLVLRACGDRIQGCCPQAERVILSGPHCLLQARPTEAACVVAGFINRVVYAL